MDRTGLNRVQGPHSTHHIWLGAETLKQLGLMYSSKQQSLHIKSRKKKKTLSLSNAREEEDIPQLISFHLTFMSKTTTIHYPSLDLSLSWSLCFNAHLSASARFLSRFRNAMNQQTATKNTATKTLNPGQSQPTHPNNLDFIGTEALGKAKVWNRRKCICTTNQPNSIANHVTYQHHYCIWIILSCLTGKLKN